MTERLPGWPWTNALPARVGWFRKALSLQHPRNKVSPPVGQQEHDTYAGEELVHSNLPSASEAIEATSATDSQAPAANARIRTRRGGSGAR